jgi:hypothetical protein
VGTGVRVAVGSGGGTGVKVGDCSVGTGVGVAGGSVGSDIVGTSVGSTRTKAGRLVTNNMPTIATKATNTRAGAIDFACGMLIFTHTRLHGPPHTVRNRKAIPLLAACPL